MSMLPAATQNPLLEGPIERICVFRALMLGDLLCAVPALRSLRAAFPAAHIALVGLPWSRQLAKRLSCIDEVIDFPGYPGLPEVACDMATLPAFLAEVRARRFDLALQMHGSGSVVNPLVASFGARQSAGFFNAEAWVPPGERHRYVEWPDSGHEIHRMLRLTEALGLPACGTYLEYPLGDEDRQALDELCPALARGPYVCIHPGAQLPSRRWSPQRFAAVADALADRGYAVVLTGTAAESTIVASVLAAMRQGGRRAISLVGQTNLWTLGALIENAQCLVCNDTGVSHIAAALGTPSVVISSGADVSRWAPLDSDLHKVLWQAMACRPCSHAVCPEVRSCADAISSQQVISVLRPQPLRVVAAESADAGWIVGSI